MTTIGTDGGALPTDPSSHGCARFADHSGHGVAGILAIISLAGLTTVSAYVGETASWATQAIAQDWFDVSVTAPAIVLATVLAARGSLRARIVLAGLLLFTTYTLAIYCFAIHLNTLFLAYCAGFGVSIFALIAQALRLSRAAAVGYLNPRAPLRVVGGFLIALGLAFGALWLSELVPAARTGTAPRALVETGLLTNPIHVLDLSFIIPLHVIAGVSLLSRRSLGFVLAASLLVFDTLMTASIAFLTVMLDVRGIAIGALPITIAMTLVAVSAAALLVSMLHGLRTRHWRPLHVIP